MVATSPTLSLNQPFEKHAPSLLYLYLIYLLITEYQNQFLDQLNGS